VQTPKPLQVYHFKTCKKLKHLNWSLALSVICKLAADNVYQNEISLKPSVRGKAYGSGSDKKQANATPIDK
jgi:hypothetical protein